VVSSGEISPKVASDLAVATTLAKPTFVIAPPGEGKMPPFLQAARIEVLHFDSMNPADSTRRLSESLRRASAAAPELPERLYERFEAGVEWIFRASGFETYRRSASRDQGADFLATWDADAKVTSATLRKALEKSSSKKPTDMGRSRILAVECKYSGKGIRLESVQAATRLKLSSDVAILVTNGQVSNRARAWSESVGVTIIGGLQLKRIAKELEHTVGARTIRRELEKLLGDN